MNHNSVRLSNMELLRLVAMLLVLITHACFLSTGVPTTEDSYLHPLATFMRFFFTSLSCVCVNVFVLISGWFGINLKCTRLLSFLFQIVFFSLLVLLLVILFTDELVFTKNMLGTILMLNPSDYWFVKAYLGLMILSPIINVWINQGKERDIVVFLILFYSFQTIYGWASLYGAQWIEGGYSAFSFVGLYVLSRYIRLYGLRRWELFIAKRKLGMPKATFYALSYLFITLLLSVVAFGVTRFDLHVAGRLFTYTQPLVILAAICLLLAFSRLHFQSKFINSIAASCFAVYLLHGNELLLRPVYGQTIKFWFENDGTLLFATHISIYIAAWFTIAILIDQVRLWLWNGFSH